MIVIAPAEKLGAASPLLIVLLVVSATQIHWFPDVLASYKPKWVTTPQFAVGAGKVIAVRFCVVPLVPLDTPVPLAQVKDWFTAEQGRIITEAQLPAVRIVDDFPDRQVQKRLHVVGDALLPCQTSGVVREKRIDDLTDFDSSRFHGDNSRLNV